MKDPQAPRHDPGEPPRPLTLSVVVPTFNRAPILRLTLDALAAQSLDPARFEVIVVDDGSSDETPGLLGALRPPYPFRWESAPNEGLARARNRGLRAAGNDVVLFLDDDVVPCPVLLAEHLREHERDRRLAVLGSLPFHPAVARSSFLWYLDRVTFFDLFRDPRKYPGGSPPMPPINGNASVRRARLQALGGYDESFRAYGGEDLDLGYRLRRAGTRFLYNPKAAGYHYHTKGFAAFCRDQERAGFAVARLAERYPEIREAKRVHLVEDPPRRLRGRELALRIPLEILLRFPLPVTLARAAADRLGRFYGLRRPLAPLYRLGSHYHYAKGIRAYLRARDPDPRADPHVPLVPRAGDDLEKPLPSARD